jgi:hypothetical protein
MKSGMRSYVVIAVCVVAALLATKLRSGDSAAAGTFEVSADTRAGTLSFAPGVDPADRAWILAAVQSARPEARRLIDEIDGMVEVRTDLPTSEAIGLAEMSRDRAIVSLDVRSLNGERAIDRNVVVLHELGHVVDFQLVSDELVQSLDAQIPRGGTCDASAMLPTGACTAVEERFADTFAKWALGGRISLAGSGYGIPAPASIEDWGRPLGLLAAQLSTR